MWKYIIIGAVVLFLFAVFVFSKNHEALVAPSGEIAALQTQYRNAIKKNKDISLDKTIKAYAQMRTEWMTNEKAKLDSEKVDFDTKAAALKEEASELQVKHDQIGGEVERLSEQMKDVLQGMAGLLELDSDAEESEITSKVVSITESNNDLEKQVAQEEATITALTNQCTDLEKQIAAARQLNKDRQARLSPTELECHVITSDPNWDYVILDAGVNKGIVIGSRLTVMRGEQKICELNVTLVETTRTSCDVVYSTLLPGERVQVGDRVISTRNK